MLLVVVEVLKVIQVLHPLVEVLVEVEHLDKVL
jgi:hypothetical protein